MGSNMYRLSACKFPGFQGRLVAMTGAARPAIALPHPKDRHSLFGDATAIDPARPTQSEYELARELGPIYELMFGADYRLLVVTGTDLAQEVWDETRFEKHIAAPLERLRDVTGDALFMAYNSEPVWGVAHRILTPGFLKPAMALYHDAMVASIESMFEYWEDVQARPRVNLTGDLNSLTFKLIGRAGFSTSFSAFAHGANTDLHPFLTQLNRAMWWISTVSNSTPIAHEQVAKLRYTRCVIDETLRLWPSAPGYFRAARVDTELGGRWPVRRGEPIFVLTLGLHRNDDWPDPLTFDPDRFLPGRDKGPYRPFGVGPRACIGRQFAVHEAVLTLASAIRRYNFIPDPDYTLTVHEQLTLKPENLYATLERRTS
jgi:cytochrome P450